MFRLLSRQAVKAVPRPGLRLSTGTSHRTYSVQLPYSGPPSYETISRRFSSSQVDPQAYFNLKQQKEAKDRGEFVDIHDVDPEYSPGPNEYDVLLSDVTHAKLQSTIAEQLGIAYLSEAADAKEVIQVSTGYIYGLHKRTIVPFIVTYGKEARWVFFIVDSGSPWTYLSAQASKVLGFQDEAAVTIGGYPQPVHVPSVNSHFADVNVLGTDFCWAHKVFKVEDYAKRRVTLYFSGNWKVVEASEPEL